MLNKIKYSKVLAKSCTNSGVKSGVKNSKSAYFRAL